MTRPVLLFTTAHVRRADERGEAEKEPRTKREQVANSALDRTPRRAGRRVIPRVALQNQHHRLLHVPARQGSAESSRSADERCRRRLLDGHVCHSWRLFDCNGCSRGSSNPSGRCCATRRTSSRKCCSAGRTTSGRRCRKCGGTSSWRCSGRHWQATVSLIAQTSVLHTMPVARTHATYRIAPFNTLIRNTLACEAV